MKTITKIVVILAATVMTAGCATHSAYDAYGCAYPNYGGAVIGGLAGGLIGAQIGSGSGRTAATAIGAGTGAVIGSQAGC